MPVAAAAGGSVRIGVGVATLVAGLRHRRPARRSDQPCITAGANDAIEADSLATSAVEQALSLLNTDPGWRTNYKSGAENGPFVLGRGTASFTLVDEYDGDLGNDKLQPVGLDGTGVGRPARRVYRRAAPADGNRAGGAEAAACHPGC